MEAQLAQTLPLDFAVHNIQPGDWVLVKEWKETPLVAKWCGPFQVLLTTKAAIKTAEHRWTHHTRVKVSAGPEIWTSQLEEKDGKPRLTLCRSGLEQQPVRRHRGKPRVPTHRLPAEIVCVGIPPLASPVTGGQPLLLLFSLC
ncbi:hypothetical protein Nmel_002973 [Mimus melanotis]